jgi:hypothetical protein
MHGKDGGACQSAYEKGRGAHRQPPPAQEFSGAVQGRLPPRGDRPLIEKASDVGSDLKKPVFCPFFALFVGPVNRLTAFRFDYLTPQ